MKDKRFKKIKKIIKEGGEDGKYELGGVRARIHELRSETEKTDEMKSLLDEIDHIKQTKVVPYMDRSFSDVLGLSDCGNFQRHFIATTKKAPNGSIASLLSSLKTGVTTPILYHLTLRYYTNETAGHFFSLLLRPKRRPYIIQQDVNNFNLFQYVFYNIIRGIKNPMSKNSAKIEQFLNEVFEYKSVPVSLFAYLFGYVWDKKDGRVPVAYVKVMATTVPNDTLNFVSMSSDSSTKSTEGVFFRSPRHFRSVSG